MSHAVKPAPYATSPPAEATNQLGMVALVLGVIGLVFGCPISLAAMITGWMGMKKEPSGMARVGFWLGTAALVLQVVVLVFALLYFGAALGIGLTAVEVQRAPDAPVMIETQAAPPMEATEVQPDHAPDSSAPVVEPPIGSESVEPVEETAPAAP